MQLRDYWRVLSKRWWIIVLIALVTSATAYGYSKLQQPLYRSSATLYVTPRRYDYGLTMVIQNLMRQYSQQLESDMFLNKVSEDLKLDLPAATLKSRIHTSGTVDNLAIRIDVDDSDPAKAQAIAGALGKEFLANHEIRMEQVEKADKVDVYMYDNPTPATLYRPRTKVNTIAGGLLGLLVAGVIVFFLEYLDDTIKTPADVERYVAAPVVGNIPSLVTKAYTEHRLKRGIDA